MPPQAYDQDDLNNAILCVWKEARGDGNIAMNAVAHVIFNRVGAPGFAATLHDVIYGKNQFSSMSISTDPEYNLAAPGVSDRQYPSYLAATNIVKAIVAGTSSDPTNGALYYANLKQSTSGWFFQHIVNDPVNHPLRATLGHQVFYT
jgi:spore germination cell wall hydrolase CwlJ-like protein